MTDKLYVVSEEEFKEIEELRAGIRTDIWIKKIKSKQPAQIIAEGKINSTKEKHTHNRIFSLISDYGIFISQKFESYEDKSGTLIFIPEEKL